MKHRSSDDQHSTARGHVRRGGREEVAETWFYWRDPETGERLAVALGVSDSFRERLAAAGFQPAAEPTGRALVGGRESGRPGLDAGTAAPAA
ncbi:MAG: hypothetical protein R3F49_22350 [Planctomycetota bacterium]